ncbi:MAG: ABC transporter permease [Acidobacteria bacterium]|nr:ABC transporter permease [Acidobacteriota bacterium]
MRTLRSLSKSRAFAGAVLAAIAIGAGVNSGLYSVVDLILKRTLPLPDLPRLIWIEETNRSERTGGTTVAALDAKEWIAESRSLEGVGIFRNFTHTILTEGRRTRVDGAECSKELFPVLGLKPRLGRWFTRAEESSSAQVVVIDEEYWKERYGADPSVIGKQVLDADWGFPNTIIGVAPRSPLWTMLKIPPPALYFAVPYDNRSAGRAGQFFSIGKLTLSASVDSAKAELRVLAARLAAHDPATNLGVGVKVAPLADTVAGVAGAPARLLLAASLAVSILALTGLMQLVAARVRWRSGEVALRMALGASPLRAAAPVMLEVFAVAAAGCALAPAIAWLTCRGLALFLGARTFSFLLVSAPASRRAAAVAVCAGLAMLACAVAVIAAAVHRRDLAPTLARRTDRAPGSGRLWPWAIGAQMAVSLALVVSTATLLGFASKLSAQDLGFDWTNCSSFFATLSRSPRILDDEECYRIIQSMLARIRTVPGVIAVASSYPAPAAPNVLEPVTPMALTRTRPVFSRVLSVTPNFFETMRMHTVAGRVFEPGECPSGDATVVNEAFARAAWPTEPPVGRLLARWHRGADKNFRVIGVVADTRDSALAAPMPAVYGCDTHDWFHVVVRTRDNSQAALAAVSREISNSGPLVDFDPPTAMERAVSSTWVAARTIGELLAAFAAFGLALGGVSVFTGTAYVIALRSREFGIRSALGAAPWTLALLALKGTARACLIGILAGAPLSWAAHRLSKELLFNGGGFGWRIVAGAAVTLIAAALLAAAGPALRAASVDPATVLRAD